ncbi:MAG: tRNA (adenosine(37)-N6)-dimethylallyltransferase MiaA [Lachnospiraceae bacterium]|nr:tRNA (adenosine(37)-N6)-dimethylallyltransferase MiaA [Lachnospiraceae bacterium]
MKKPLIILAGPTAVGKTETSIGLAKAVSGEIISADSMQVYRHMDIGSAKIKPEEMQGINHYLIDELEPEEEFNVVLFQTLAKKYMEEIYAKGKIPILVGGTGFYIQSVLYDIDFTNTDADNSYRMELEQLAKEKGPLVLHEMLRKVDEKSAEEIHANNKKRVIRALEYYKQTGKPISEHNEEERAKKSPYNFAYFVLNDERATVYDRINKRVDIMFAEGLISEVEQLMSRGCKREMVSMQGLGYKEVIDYLEGKYTLEETREMIQKETRHFAKRQLTWFRREEDVIWINKNELEHSNEKILQYMTECLQDRKII